MKRWVFLLLMFLAIPTASSQINQANFYHDLKEMGPEVITFEFFILIAYFVLFPIMLFYVFPIFARNRKSQSYVQVKY